MAESQNFQIPISSLKLVSFNCLLNQFLGIEAILNFRSKFGLTGGTILNSILRNIFSPISVEF